MAEIDAYYNVTVELHHDGDLFWLTIKPPTGGNVDIEITRVDARNLFGGAFE